MIKQSKVFSTVGLLLILVSISAYRLLTSYTAMLMENVTADSRRVVNLSESSSFLPLSLTSTPPDYYSWTGNQWIPPHGVSLFSALDFLQYFQKRNVLFIGDSTARRAWASLSATMTANDLNNIQVQDIDSRGVIDVNKGGTTDDCSNKDRNFYNQNFTKYFICRDLLSANRTSNGNNNNVDSNATHATNEAVAPSSSFSAATGKFDFLPLNCLEDLTTYFSPPPIPSENNNSTTAGAAVLPSLLSRMTDYDLVLFAVGVHDVYGKCPKSTTENTVKMNTFLQTLKEVSSPDLQVAVRTTSLDKRRDVGKKEEMLVNTTLDFFKELQYEQEADGDSSNFNMTLIDWASVINKRSYDNERIDGDLKAHYGLVARQLFHQQFLHELMVADQQQKLVADLKLRYVDSERSITTPLL
jgi:hypothetical protein